MKSSIWTIVIVLIMVAGISIYAGLTAKHVTDLYLGKVAELETLVSQGRNEEAAQAARPLYDQWLEDCRFLQFIAFHQDTNKVDSYLYMLKAGFETQNDVVILWALHELTESLENIYQREAVMLVNIF